MRIGLIAPPWVPVPPPAYGGTEAVIDNLARGLQRRGHDVRLFTVAESECPVTCRHLYPRAVRPLGVSRLEIPHVLAAYKALAGCDIIHDHTAAGPLVAGQRGRRRPPVVITWHSVITTHTAALLKAAGRHVSIVAISASQAGHAAANRIPVAAVIHHGIDLDVYQPGPGGGGYLMFIGRMSPDKGVHHAIRIARDAGRELVISAKMRDHGEREYYEEQVAPLLTGEQVTEIPLAERVRLLRHADALVNPVSWAEPFGLVMAEALACGTPVLAFPGGAAPEIIRHGVTGWLSPDPAVLAGAVPRLAGIDRSECAREARARFSLHRMAADHERLYARVLSQQPLLGLPPLPSGYRVLARGTRRREVTS
jgi:glycosyltransferase involved in cell wall biosynthesis